MSRYVNDNRTVQENQSCYLETKDNTQKKCANVCESETYNCIVMKLKTCGNMFKDLQCLDGGHIFSKRLFCGQEFCPSQECQESIFERRKARKWKHFVQLGEHIGLFTFTIPRIFRDRLDLMKLKQLHQYLRDKFKREFKGEDLRAIGRLHWFSDDFFKCNSQGKCKYKGWSKREKFYICKNYNRKCQYKEDLRNPFNPHFHILINQKWLDNEIIDKFKLGWKRKLQNTFHKEIPCAVVNYKYVSRVEKRLHELDYVFRNTFRVLKGYEDIAVKFVKYRNSIKWGSFTTDPLVIEMLSVRLYGKKKDKDDEDNESALKIVKKVCPVCGGQLVVLDGIRAEKFHKSNFIEIGLSFYYYTYKDYHRFPIDRGG